MRVYKDGFVVLDWSLNRKLLVYMDARQFNLYDKEREEYLKFYKQENLNGLAFENSIYYPYTHLDVLEEYPFIEHLFIGQKKIKDFSAIKYVRQLKGLYFEDNSAEFDFTMVKESLEYLSTRWHAKLKNIEQLYHLKWLWIEQDDDDVHLPAQVEKLDFFRSKKTHLDALASCKAVKIIVLDKCTKLANIQGLKYVGQSIEELRIEKCKNLEDFSPILELDTLKSLKIIDWNKENKENLKYVYEKLVAKTDVNIHIHPKLK
ncbi:hypothetical protein [Haliscomenobacter hydrossis]|uniref:Leucine-rich repeat domain-containing protein n=1 Tax=Haliscomenobacter hydrossis (strain ATCC 27775 / DSM 1100 / LMG 10767 / O) TaxID=760192 RepID=F4L3A4_HALH1|nr:hypothetical protein [Haliscomenobacter hydrossis]AEE51738.1 hypothetical protein Halhy_3888 [Haliscomenobacter hydrossis DSM 1100]